MNAQYRKQTEKDVNGNIIERIFVSNEKLAFIIELSRGMDISHCVFCGNNISFDYCDVTNPKGFDFSEKYIDKNMFFGLLTTCGLENTGPANQLNDISFCKHGSINYSQCILLNVNDMENEVEFVGKIIPINEFYQNFEVIKKIIFSKIENSIKIIDEVKNLSEEKKHVCIMYHCNFGEPFLSKEISIEIPIKKYIAKNEIAKKYEKMLRNGFDKTQTIDPHVFYLDMNIDDGKYCGEIVNKNLKTKVTLEVEGENLPKMDMWKCSNVDKCVLSLEPCNEFPYGYALQKAKGLEKYLNSKETKQYSIKFIFKELKNE